MAPYKTRSRLPDPIKEHLPSAAQEIYKDAFNNAWERFKDPSKLKYGGDRETASHRVAWFAVKKEFQKNEKGRWVKIKK
jgi:cation transport regulator